MGVSNKWVFLINGCLYIWMLRDVSIFLICRCFYYYYGHTHLLLGSTTMALNVSDGLAFNRVAVYMESKSITTIR